MSGAGQDHGPCDVTLEQALGVVRAWHELGAGPALPRLRIMGMRHGAGLVAFSELVISVAVDQTKDLDALIA